VNWTEIVKFLGSVLIGSTAISFVIRSLWSQFLFRDLEKFKADLVSKNNIEVERLRTELKKVAFEHETRYARLHEKRAEALEELFRRLVKAHAAFAARFRAGHFQGEPSIEEQTIAASNAANNFIDWFSENRLFIDDPLADKILKINRQFQEMWMTLGGPHQPEERSRITKEFFQLTPALLDEIRAKILEMLTPPKELPEA
jgi:hypothetical protein